MTTCLRCKGPTTRHDYCGICDALLFGLSDDDVAIAVERLKASNTKAAYGPEYKTKKARTVR